jgi:SAM-dependent methyltransferase
VTAGGHVSSQIDSTRPNIARVYDYLLGGKDNFEADRELGDKIKEAMPGVRLGVEQQRAVLRRVVRHLVGEAGIRQIVDIGSGLPTAGNVHETAREVDPATRVVYVDHDPVVLAHARALMADNKTTIAIGGDARHPADILDNPELRSLVDLDRPVGLLLCGILHHILDDEDPHGIVAAYRAALPTGSYVFIHHLAAVDDPAVAAAQAELQRGTGRGQFRTQEQIAEFFKGLDMVDPGLVPVTEWRPDPDTPGVDTNPVLRLAVAGLGRKP